MKIAITATGPSMDEAYESPNYAPHMSYWMPYNSPYAPPACELDTLKGQAEYLENALNDIKKRIEELEKGADTP